MNKIKSNCTLHLCIITPRYPTQVDGSAMPFVRQLAWAIADLGIRVSVICPMAINKSKGIIGLPKTNQEHTDNGIMLDIFHPKFLHFSQRRLGPLRLGEITARLFHRAVLKAFQRIDCKPDVVYGHFINPAGLSAAKLSRMFNIPAFLAYGESYFWASEGLKMNTIQRAMRGLSGVIAVSSHNKAVFDSYDFLDRDKVQVFPNGVRGELYYPRDRVEARKRLNLPQDVFIISFVGHFIPRKGLYTLNQALKQLEGVYTLFAGKGPITPEGRNNLFTGSLPSEQMPWLYSASDVFVLPTQNEGLSNAIVEAMACGLPIISSDLPFNDDILDESNSIRINPNDVDALVSAINTLQDNPELCARMAQGSLDKAKSLTLDARARNIVSFIQTMSDKGEIV